MDNAKRYAAYLKSAAWSARRWERLAMDNFECAVCKDEARQVHHLSYDHVYCEPMSDLCSLCPACHEDATALAETLGPSGAVDELKRRQAQVAEWEEINNRQLLQACWDELRHAMVEIDPPAAREIWSCAMLTPAPRHGRSARMTMGVHTDNIDALRAQVAHYEALLERVLGGPVQLEFRPYPWPSSEGIPWTD